MFTGLIEDVGIVSEIHNSGQDHRLAVRSAGLASQAEIGDSIAVDGTCLTVVSITSDVFVADVSTESLSRTTLGLKGVGDRVNLEPALRLGDRLGGHLVTGHVDGLGRIVDRHGESNGTMFTISAGPDLVPLIIEKGSITVDGVSLTVNRIDQDRFSVMVIPHTMKHTTLCDRRKGHRVNLETDLLGKYVARLLDSRSEAARPSINMETLARNGFL